MFLPNHYKYRFTPRIRQIRERFGHDQASFAKEMGLSRTALIDYENGGAIPNTFAKKLQEKFNVNYDWFRNGTGKMLFYDTEDSPENQKLENAHEGYKVPLLNQRVSCGDGANWEDEQNIESYIDIFSLIPQHKLGRLFALSVQGNSMIGAGIKNGDYVLFCTGDDPVLDDDIYVFSLDGEVFCKQLEFDIISKKIKIYSIRVADLEKAELLTTLNVEDTDFADRFHIYGRVFCWLHPNLGDEKNERFFFNTIFRQGNKGS